MGGGSEDQLIAMIDAHYAGKIKVSDYWEIGDTTKLHMKAYDAFSNMNKSKELDIDAQDARDIDFVIIGFDHDDLVTPINGITKAAVTIQSKDCICSTCYSTTNDHNTWYMRWGNYFNKYNFSSSTNGSTLDYWLNSFGFINSFNISEKIKKVKKKVIRYAQSERYYLKPFGVDSYVFLLSEYELFGERVYPNDACITLGADGIQYEYMKNKSNRVKRLDGTAVRYWTRTAVDYTGSQMLVVATDGSYSDSLYTSTSNIGVCPAFCL